MDSHSPRHSETVFDRFLQRVFQATGMHSQMELAEALGVNRSAITQARRKGSVPDRWLVLLYRGFGLNPHWLERGHGTPFLSGEAVVTERFKHVPKVAARLCAGGGSFEVDPDVQEHYAFQRDWLHRKGNPDRMVLMDVFGNSMAPEIKDGDTVLIDESQQRILAGAIFAVGIEDTIMVKRLEKHPQQLVLLSDNAAYAPLHLGDDDLASVRIIGKVIWICRELR